MTFLRLIIILLPGVLVAAGSLLAGATSQYRDGYLHLFGLLLTALLSSELSLLAVWCTQPA